MFVSSVFHIIVYTVCVRLQRSKMSALTKMEVYFKKDFMQYTGRSATLIRPYYFLLFKDDKHCSHK